MKASMARSLATATVKPRGSKDACDTHDAIIADFAVPRAALTTYKPPLCKVAATLAISHAKVRVRVSFSRRYAVIDSWSLMSFGH